MSEAPTVGNVLGFSLLFRDRKALLCLERRTLLPGVRLTDYEAEVPNVEFPMQAPVSASEYRHHRCRALAVTLDADPATVSQWVRARLVGETIGGLRVEQARFVVDARFGARSTERAALELDGALPGGGRGWLRWGLEITVRERWLDVSAGPHWWFGRQRIDAAEVWRALGELLGGVRNGSAFALDLASHALTPSFVSAGWKAPDLSSLAVDRFEIGPKICALGFVPHDDARAPTPPSTTAEPTIAADAAAARSASDSGTMDLALAALTRVVGALDGDPVARAAALRWMVELLRHAPASLEGATEAALVRVSQWRHAAPDDPLAARWELELLARNGQHTALMSVLEQGQPDAEDHIASARRDIAVAGLLVRKLGKSARVESLLLPHRVRLDEDPAMAPLQSDICRLLAIAAANDPQLARTHLQAALAATEPSDPKLHTEIRTEVARALAAHGHETEAFGLVREALETSPDDASLLDLAATLAGSVGATDVATDLLKLKIERTPAAQAQPLRRELALRAADSDDDDALALVREALQPDERDPRLLAAAARLERDAGQHATALELLGRLRDRAPNGRAEARLRWQRVELLATMGRVGEVWAELWPALPELEPALVPDAFACAVEFSPSGDVDAWVRRLRARVDADRLIGALRARWRRWQEPDAAAEHLVVELTTHDRQPEAIALCKEIAARSEGSDRARWLTRAASMSTPTAAAALIDEALRSAPGDQGLTDRLIDVLRATGQTGRVTSLWRARAADPEVSQPRRIDAIDRLIMRRLGGQSDAIAAAAQDHELVELFRHRAQVDPDDATTQLVLARDETAAGNDVAAREHYARLLELVPDGDPRSAAAAVVLGAYSFDHGQHEAARSLLERASKARPTDPQVWPLLHRVAQVVGDDGLLLEALGILMPNVTDPSKAVAYHLELARLHRRRSNIADALAAIRGASTAVDVGSAQHLEVAEAWLELAREDEVEPQHEAEARAELRRALGGDLPASEVRVEAMLLAEHLSDPQGAVTLVENALGRLQGDALLLSTLKQLCLANDLPDHYVAALQLSIDQAPPGAERDALLVELTATAVDNGDALLALRALDRLSPEASAADENLDLRDWAVHQLGREDDELREVGDALRTNPSDGVALARLRRLERGDPAAVAEHLLGLATDATPQTATALSVLALRQAKGSDEGPVLRRALRRALGCAGQDPRVWDAWRGLARDATTVGDETTLRDVLAMARDASAGDPNRANELDEQLESGLLRYPASRLLMRLVWDWARDEAPEDPAGHATRRIGQLVETREPGAQARAELYIGLAEHLDRRSAASLLRGRAEAELAAPEAIWILARALGERGHVPEQLAALEGAVSGALDDAAKVEALKRLAHVSSETLADASRAIEHFETALELAPTDPDLLLPLLEHYYDETDLNRAIALTHRVLTHVPMGDAAFLSLAHRAADAALAGGEHDTATEFLRQAAARAPDDAKTQARLAELEALEGDPEHRVKLLAAIANRQTTEARLEALEERARLLVDPLGRMDEAISELETIAFEAPRRTSATELLESLYGRTERWTDLVALYERRFPREHGATRCETLRAIASIYRDQLLDLPRAEQALRIALDHLGSDEAHRDLAERIRVELVGDLEGQGRYVDLSIYLERALAEEVGGSVEGDLHPTRAELLVELARIYRGPLDDETKAGRIYERLEAYGCLPDEGLATLARTYHRAGRHADLVRILNVRRQALEVSGETARRAAVDQRIAELLEGPLGRPHEAATHYLDAYLADPRTNVAAGSRARVLLSGTDAVANVRRRLLERLPQIHREHRPALLTLLGDILGPHDDYEQEALERYEEALELQVDYAPAREALGRLLARQGRLSEAVEPLVEASKHPDIPPRRAAEDAAIAARALLELDRPEDAEVVLKDSLQRAPDSQRALLELARLYERLGRTTEQAIVLENLSQLPLSSMLGAEVAFRRATLLMPATADDPYCPEAGRARAYLLEAVSADAKHVAARQTLLELARARLEWSIVAHMHYLAIRELPPGPQRALHHLDLAETYLLHLDDSESAIRNVESAITQAPNDLVVSSRVGKLAAQLPGPARVAERFERIASGSGDLDDAARARLWLLAADLRMTDDDPAAAEAASQKVLDLGEVPMDVAAAAHRNLEKLAGDEARDLRQQKSGLLKLLEVEEAAVERVHILGRLRELGRSLGDTDLVEWASREQLELAGSLEGDEGGSDLEAASAALRDVYAERGSYDDIVDLYERLAQRSEQPAAQSAALIEAARFSWNGLRQPDRAVVLLRRALAVAPDDSDALAMLGEVTRQSDDVDLEAAVYEELQRVPPEQRSARLSLQLAGLAANLGREQDAIALLRPLCVQPREADVRYEALRQLDTILARAGSATERLPILRRLLEESTARASDETAGVALSLAECELALGDTEGSRRTIEIGLEHDASHRGLLDLKIRTLRAAEEWADLATTIEQLAAASVDPATHAGYLVDAAEVHLRRQALASAPRERARAAQEARRLLVRACQIAPTAVAPRVVLLPLSFAEKRWDEVLELSLEVREHASDDEEVLILAGITEAFRHGQRSLARDLGFRHGSAAQDRYLYPGLRQLLTEVAKAGPLPRLDALLAAAAALCGGRIGLANGLRTWTAGRPMQVGLALGLARLAEAEGSAELARNLYQIAAFMAPDGPVPPLVARLPIAVPPSDLDPAASGPMEGRSLLRTILVRTRSGLAGISSDLPDEGPPSVAARTRMALADSIVAPWRRALDLPLPLAWTRAKVGGGVGVRNWNPATIVLGSGVAAASVPELRYRLAGATAAIAGGFAVLEEEAGVELGDLLDALGRIANPGHVPTGRPAQVIADALSQRGTSANEMPPAERAALADELAHWLTDRGGLHRLRTQLSRAQKLFAARLSGQLDGALLAVAHDNGFIAHGRPDPVVTLRHDDVQWLLRALGMY